MTDRIITADARTTDPVAFWRFINADRYAQRERAKAYGEAMTKAREAGDIEEWARLALEYNEVTR